MTYKILQKNANIFRCETCDFVTGNKFNYLKHLDTRKHKTLTKTDTNLAKDATPNFVCLCGKSYKHRQSLYAHKKVCFKKDVAICETALEHSNVNENSIINNVNNENNENNDFKDLVCKMMTENNEIKAMLIKENQELRSQIKELIPKVGNNNTITNNNINNKFNIQIFLNEQCKDAINIKDFIESIKITLQQLEQIQNKGLVDGLATAILENIGRLSLYERPIHCTDIKRETLYIKHDDIWEKDETKQNIKKAIKELSHKPYSTLKEWLDNNPNYMDDENKQNYFIQTTRSLGQKCESIDTKVIKKICINTYIKDDMLIN
uniref:C2H2-type domain-containing protein n=1 Tax=viral metagenome TaxID=1070528 RepID=A0A6C0D5M5_9ZZZZ